MITQLPDDFKAKPKTVSHTSVTISPYSTTEEVVKSKVQLQTYLFSFLLEGTKYLHLFEDQSAIHPDSFLFLKPTHCLMSERFKLGSEYKSLLCFFESDFVNAFAVKYQLSNTNTPTPDFLKLPVDDFVRHFVRSMQMLLAQPSIKSSAIWLLKMEELLLYLLDKYGEVISGFLMSNHAKDLEMGFHQIIQNNIDNKLNLDELAFLCKMSLSTFKRKFRDVYEDSPARWFQKQRLLKAKLLLTHSRQTPSEVYEEAGFENFSSFSQAFKKEFGQSPKTFKNSH